MDDGTKATAQSIAFYAPDSGTGTGKHVCSDCLQAFGQVNADQKRNARTMLIAAGVTLALLCLSRLVWLLKPVFDLVRYGIVSEVFYYVIIAVMFTVYIFLLNRFLKKRCNARIFAPVKEHMSITAAVAIIALCAVTVFISAIGLNFKVKIELELGSFTSIMRALINITIYVYYGLHLWLGLTAATLIQRAMSTLFPAKFNIPWGAVALVTVFGLTELAFEWGTTTHLYPWLYYVYTYIYAAIFEISGHRFHVTYWASLALLVL